MTTTDIKLSSPAFPHEGNIPSKYTCDGEDINPQLELEQIPEGTVSLALIMEDPDAPRGTFDHWVVWNIAPVQTIKENHMPGISGNNGAGRTGYHGPCPPGGQHRYYFHIYALDTDIDLPVGSGKAALQQAMVGHILAKGTLVGRYERKQ